MNQQYKQVCFEAPSNIAFVKYWGKHGRQLPNNPSISMTLTTCKSIFNIEYLLEDQGKGVESFFFENQENEKFKIRISKYLNDIADVYPLSKRLTLKIMSKNTFPHSAGIASSASAMGALACCLAQIEVDNSFLDMDEYTNRASFLARLASGSACRSIQGKYVTWGKNTVNNGTDDYAAKVSEVHPVFENLCDSVLIVSGEEKAISSSVGHQMMEGHSYNEARISQANENYTSILTALKNGNLALFGTILENEALSLHALMMSSNPPYILLKPHSLILIEKIRELRIKHDLHMYFTIDAGPNIHLIYPLAEKDKVFKLIEEHFRPFCESVIHDEAGNGARQLHD